MQSRRADAVTAIAPTRRAAGATSLDAAFSIVVLGTIAPVALMLVGWWGSLGVAGDGPWIAQSAFGGLALGLALDITMLRPHLGRIYELPMAALAGVAGFYSVMIYGFFMGFPVPNALVGIAGGWVVGRRATLLGLPAERGQREGRIVAVAATAILFALCCASAWLALNEPTIGSELQHMFGLPFALTDGMVRALVVVGGTGLVVAEYAATRTTARWAARLPTRA